MMGRGPTWASFRPGSLGRSAPPWPPPSSLSSPLAPSLAPPTPAASPAPAAPSRARALSSPGHAPPSPALSPALAPSLSPRAPSPSPARAPSPGHAPAQPLAPSLSPAPSPAPCLAPALSRGLGHGSCRLVAPPLGQIAARPCARHAQSPRIAPGTGLGRLAKEEKREKNIFKMCKLFNGNIKLFDYFQQWFSLCMNIKAGQSPRFKIKTSVASRRLPFTVQLDASQVETQSARKHCECFSWN